MRKLVSIILIGVIIINVYSFSYAENQEENQENENQEQLKEEQKEVNEQLTQAEDDLEELKSELSQNLQELYDLDAKIEESEEELVGLNSEIQELEKEIKEAELELETTVEVYEEKKTAYEERLIVIYETGELRYLDMLLEAQNINEFISSYFLINEMAEYDSEVLLGLQIEKEEIELTKQKLEIKQETLGVIKENATKTTRILENTRTVRENYASRLSEEEKIVQAEIDLYKQRMNEINSEILILSGGINGEYIGGVFAWPVPGYTRITSYYGMRDHPVTGVYKLHTGIDIGAPTGVSFIAVNDGIVTKAEYNSAYGNMVIVDHGGGVSTLYAHGSEISVTVGQFVSRGDEVLKIGSTGYSTGPHAHFEVRLQGITVDPLPYITNGLEPETQGEEEQEVTENDDLENKDVEE